MRLVERIKELLIGRADEFAVMSADTQSRPVPTLRPDHASGVRQLLERMDEIDPSQSVMAGCVQLLGLDKIKARLGSRWETVADKALLITKRC